ncbi:hypothetical protein HBI72_171460 [Parastagonospora nodorum]|nr:hypothetical protein HBI72_171460 [Parastagonospora nodorum]
MSHPTPTLVNKTIHTTTTTTALTSLSLPLDPLTNLLILFSIPLLALLARLRPRAPTHPLSQHLLPWRTDSWAALYGLLRLSYDNKWGKDRNAWVLSRSLHAIWHDAQRPYLGRLLAMGVIPLSIHDGGVRTERYEGWKVTWERGWPRVQWPMYVQARRRACFEFMVVRAEEDEARGRFVSDLVTRVVEGEAGRDERYGVTMREAPPHPGMIRYSWYNRPAKEEVAMQVGARSAVPALLPFLKDEVLEKGYGERANSLSVFVHNNDPGTIPLLELSSTKIVRVEAMHYGACELDSFVFGMAQDAGLEVIWPERMCREAALAEMRECGLPTEGLKSFASSVLEQYR